MRLIVIEPHADDAFLSVGGHLETRWVDRGRLIVTVFCDKIRARESAAYAAAVGASNVVLDAQNGRRMTEGGAGVEVPELTDWLTSNLGDDDDIVGPLGIQHPDHRSVALTLSAWDHLKYIDTPYQSKPMNEDEMMNLTCDRCVESIYWPMKRKWRHAALFKSQAKFFHFNPLQDWKLPEIVLRDRA